MPRIVCRACGREVYATAPIEQLFAEERRCPRCGAVLQNDRRADERRKVHRRANPQGDPGPPTDAERRVAERRVDRRRDGDGGAKRDSGGWLE
ncbi:MAG: hypothetical protein HYX54_11110 [Chloroflexi bacterium]|nr:hypothetical protein [Chloroflexota bacterium]